MALKFWKLVAGVVAGVVVGSAALSSAAVGQTRTVEVESFNAIEASNGIHVIVSMGARRSVVIEGPAGEAAQVYVHVRDGRLIVRPRLRRLRRGPELSKAIVRVTVTELIDIEAENGAELTATGINAPVIELEATNGGVLRIDGTCGAADVVARRGGRVDAGDLACREVKARASMGGEMTVNAAAVLDAGAGMGAMIEVRGAPGQVDQSSSLGGMIYSG